MRSQGHHLERPVAIASDAQQSLCVRGIGITNNGNLLWLRQGVAERLKSLPEAQRIVGHHGLHLCQRLVGDVDITHVVGEPSQLEQSGDCHASARRTKANQGLFPRWSCELESA